MSKKPAGRKAPSALNKVQNADRNRRIAIQVGVAAVLIGLVAAIGISIAVKQAAKNDPGPTPTIAAPAAPNGVTGSITDTGAIRIGKPDAKVAVRLVADLQCPACKNFEATFGPVLEEAVNNGTASVDYNIISFLDAQSGGAEYSSRAANAAYCVASADPSKFQTWLNAMYVNQPAEGGSGLPNSELIELAKSVGYTDDVAGCINDRTYDKFVHATTEKVFDSGVTSTPTVYVNEQQVQPSQLAQAIAAASGQ